jgi:hypothetical protein
MCSTLEALWASRLSSRHISLRRSILRNGENGLPAFYWDDLIVLLFSVLDEDPED